MQTTQNTAKSTVKRKRIYHLIPELRERVPGMYDRMRADDVAEQFGIPVRDVLDEAIRDLRRTVKPARSVALLARRAA